MLLDKPSLAEIGRLGLLRAPEEACGVLLPSPLRGSRVHEMPNRSSRASDSFMFCASDVREVLAEWLAEHPDGEATIWHTHPGGNVGPSAFDLGHRVEEAGNLVVALTPEGPKAAWY